MLARIETFYLGILRVVILVVATLALLSAALLFVRAAPTLLQQFGFARETPVDGGTLGQFIAEKRATSTRSIPSDSSATAPSESAVDPDIAEAAQKVAEYLNDPSYTRQDWERAITQSLDRVPAGSRQPYIASIGSLAEQLKVSKGKKLTSQQVGELFAWHERRFVANAATRDAERIIETGKTSFYLYSMMSAFALFLMITFAFLFVKIERSLRVVRTREVGAIDE